ncbi:hypothetical protein [Novosphingobium beihaiensis]|uniref:Glycerophosphoryl diester phosphodiesterase membrane domain-containing protein n=1 Tax=Novosphingobium beihaiensis TaxID=2930389 RepID=A0ABT0BLZ9_9SPHN|nr:hypothetical protein [Novosphingobium beihaiensis]MCJ2186065.1 hypothetical protein [Novosphingobium beihaiensis]
MEMASKVEVGPLFEALFALMRRYVQVLLLATFSLAALDTALVIGLGEKAQFLGNIVSIGVVFAVLRHLLRREGMVEDEGGFGSYFVAQLLSGLGVIVGFVLLIVPGLYLLARWSVAPSLVVGRGLRASDALGASWDATRNCAWTLTIVYLISIVVMLGGIFGTGVAVGAAGGTANSFGLVAFTQIAGDFFAVAGAYLNVTIYAHVIGNRGELQDVFV